MHVVTATRPTLLIQYAPFADAVGARRSNATQDALQRFGELVVDDEPLARRRLASLIAEVPWATQIGEATDGATALDVIARHRPAAVFLDIQMPAMSGLEVVTRLRTTTQPPVVIFTTAHDQYAVAAFELEAHDDYVLVHRAQRRHLLSLRMSDLEQRLPHPPFIRVHRSHLVNLDYVERIVGLDGSRFEVIMKNGARVPVSRARSQEIRRLSC